MNLKITGIKWATKLWQQNILFTITMINTIYNMLCGLEIYEM